MQLLTIVFFTVLIFINTFAYPVTYDQVRGIPYRVSYDHRAITINGNRTLLFSGVIHYPRSTPAMWPYLMSKAKEQGLNTIQTYVFWNIHEQKRGTYDFSGRANLSLFLQEAANAGLFVNLRLGPYVCAEWDYGALPVWLNNIPNIAFRSSNDAWKSEMKRFLSDIIVYVDGFLAKNGGPIILAQIENEYGGNDRAYVDWCGSLVSNDFASTQIPWIMCNGLAANSTIETCNGCNCFDDGWMDRHRRTYPNQPLLFTENWGWFQGWGEGLGIRTPEDLAYSVAEWFANGGAYHAYYMWHGGNHYGRTGGSGLTTAYSDDVILRADGTPNEPKFTHLNRLQRLLASQAQVLLSQDSNRLSIPYWNGKQWTVGTQQMVYSYPPSVQFVINQAAFSLFVLFNKQNISIAGQSVQIYDYNEHLLWNSADVSGISRNNTFLVPIVVGPLDWQVYSEPFTSDLPVIVASTPLEQLNLTNDETIYLWYRRNVSLSQPSVQTIVQVQTRRANSLLFFMDRQFVGYFDDHSHTQGTINVNITLNLSQFLPNQQYIFEILSVSLGIDNFNIGPGSFEYKGIVGNVSLGGQSLVGDEASIWEHQKGLFGEAHQIYTEQGSKTVEWNPKWTTVINKPVTWFQTRFDLNHLAREDLNANPILLDAFGFNRGHAFVNGNDIGLYWLIEGTCQNNLCCCLQNQTNCQQPSQRYYHISSDWLKPTNNLLTVFEEIGASSPKSVGLVQRIINT
ncbi:hypothetical protein I4U23_005497 [Adineta vaga]|uniref:Beta-galactosidase n=1 Tax=Adineta vaga TaxID=104782 RepID=B3G4G0_ADIVA|nr:beta-D-galactosidase-like protein [Adineta vaga]UJR18590.1 hypothetical protein I4U23_005497 [Adineta vaga]